MKGIFNRLRLSWLSIAEARHINEDLLPPYNQDAEVNGGLGYDALGPGATRLVPFGVRPWSQFQDGDQIFLISLKDQRVVASKAVDKSYAYRPFSVDASPSDLRQLGDGVHEFRFQVKGALGREINSGPVSIEFKTTKPGGLDPEDNHDGINKNLAPPIVDPSPLGADLGNVALIIRRWDGFVRSAVARGDRLTAFWNGLPIVFPPLTDEQLSLPEFRVPVPEEIIREGGGGLATINYSITDRVGNYSGRSVSRIEDVPIDNPDLLPMPWVEGVVGGQLRLVDIPGVNVRIHVENHQAPAGSSIEILWMAGTPPWTSRMSVTTANEPLTFLMPIAEANLRAGSVVVRYVRLADGAESNPLNLRVIGLGDLPGDGKLAPMIFVKANGAKQVLYPDLIDGTDVDIPAYANHLPNDTIFLLFECFENDNPGYTHDPAEDIPIPSGNFQLGPFQPGDSPPPWRYHIPRDRIFFDRTNYPRYHIHARYSVAGEKDPSHPVLSDEDFVRISLLGNP